MPGNSLALQTPVGAFFDRLGFRSDFEFPINRLDSEATSNFSSPAGIIGSQAPSMLENSSFQVTGYCMRIANSVLFCMEAIHQICAS